MVRAVLLVLLFVLLVTFWPAVYGVSNHLRFGELANTNSADLLLFLLLGLIGALAAILPSLTRRYTGCLSAGLIGYMIAAPISFIGSIFGGLIVPPWVAVIILGSVPLLVFTFIGYQIGEKMHRHKRWGYH